MSDKTRERVRAEFEAHYSKTYNKPPHLIRDSRVRNAIVSDGCTETHHLGIDLNIAYRAWQAAHEMYAPKWISGEDRLPEAGVEEFTWANFVSYLIDNCEGEAITEERLQHALSQK